MSLQVKIIGSSHAGANVAYNLRRDGFEGDIEIISTESFPPYHRPPLSKDFLKGKTEKENCLLYTSPSPRDAHESRMPSSA